MAKASVVNEFEVDPNLLWGKVKQFNNMHEHLPSMITSCELQGIGQGAKRICGTENGPILETLQLLDDANMTLEYSIDNEDAPMPVSNYLGTVSVKKLADQQAEFTWSAVFEPKGMPEAEVVAMLEGAFNALQASLVESV